MLRLNTFGGLVLQQDGYDFRFTAAEAGLATFLIESVQLEAGQTKALEITEWPAE